MHLTKADAEMLGSYAIVGAHLPMAVGAAWSARLRGTGQVAVAFFGDGATNIGAFHEALNLAAVWKLPVMFVCENNLYMEYTPIGAVTAVPNPAADRAAGVRHPGRGRSTATTWSWSATRSPRRPSGRARATARPSSRRRPTGTTGTAAPIRRSTGPAEEVERWLERDPLDVARAGSLRSGVAGRRLEQTDARADAVVDGGGRGGEERARRRPGRGVHRRVGGRRCGMADMTAHGD